jgi:hypothetical protein
VEYPDGLRSFHYGAAHLLCSVLEYKALACLGLASVLLAPNWCYCNEWPLHACVVAVTADS